MDADKRPDFLMIEDGRIFLVSPHACPHANPDAPCETIFLEPDEGAHCGRCPAPSADTVLFVWEDGCAATAQTCVPCAVKYLNAEVVL